MNPLPDKSIIAMIHVAALPGTPRGGQSVASIARRAAAEAKIYADAGVDALMIENMHDLPYLNGRVGPEVVAAMAVVGAAVRAAADEATSARAAAAAARSTPDPATSARPAARLPLGVQILAAANHEALAVAHAIGAQFVRVENFVFSHVADEGLMPTAAAGPLLRYRRQIGADEILIFADIKKKHSSHALTADLSLAETASAAEFFGADGVIVTGSATGQPTCPDETAAVRQRVRIPVFVGSGTTPENLPQLWPHASGFIVGSTLKHDGLWSNDLDPARLAAFMHAARTLRNARASAPAQT